MYIWASNERAAHTLSSPSVTNPLCIIPPLTRLILTQSMKLSIYSLGTALSIFSVTSVLGMEMALEERLLDASTSTDPIHMKDQTTHQCEDMARSGDSLQERIFHGIKSQFLPKKKAPPTVGTMAVRLSNPLLNLDQTQRMREFAQKATAMISDTASYSDKVLAWKGIFQEGLSLWETKQKDVDGWRVLGFLEKLCSLAPANMEVVQVLIGKFPDELKLKLKAVEEYPVYFEEIPSDLTECWARATLIGSYQRRIKAEAPEKLGTTRIDKIIKEYLMAAKLPQCLQRLWKGTIQ
ncbi:uncharacterized protein MELLADRAFT_106877 [Melampsora larici-populina 98AG31]|uniref:Uncharacterized protein n=1 Tax=Melampsora larici-populina (strain 98AG31 / pathotype 3-4-7) TaxID=747676 RepID=F4RMY2_MELLP|nr:uncharacterized protein MELLADRAFT_106877 [Melampsora larici-populina 98AG31]EGG06196.1 hypothetical protein MELLADRAFT_106877 [Melampsora larici-populina 98AG31]